MSRCLCSSACLPGLPAACRAGRCPTPGNGPRSAGASLMPCCAAAPCRRVDLEVAKRTGNARQRWLVERVEPVRGRQAGWRSLVLQPLDVWQEHASSRHGHVASLHPTRHALRPPPATFCSSRSTRTGPCAPLWSSTPRATPRCRSSSTGALAAAGGRCWAPLLLLLLLGAAVACLRPAEPRSCTGLPPSPLRATGQLPPLRSCHPASPRVKRPLLPRCPPPALHMAPGCSTRWPPSSSRSPPS